MKSIKLLDCTLRDGGYMVNWNFGYNSIKNIFTNLVESKIDIIELGYLRDDDKFDYNRTSYPDTQSVDYIFDMITESRPMLVAIIDYGKCAIEHLSHSDESVLDGIRLTFKKNEIDEALTFGKHLMEKGYKLFLQAVSITDYSKDEYLELIQKTNDLSPYAISIVDTYGLLQKNDLFFYFRILEENLKQDIIIAYHSHNNFQIAYSNTMDIINYDSKHELIIDSTVNGIGKDAGNACTELLVYFLNKNHSKSYNITCILEIIKTELEELKKRITWGYSLIGFISALTGCRTEYVKYLLNKNELSISSIYQILLRIDKDKKTSNFFPDHIEQLYIEFSERAILEPEGIFYA